jgi:hypothetical protein
VDGAGRPLWTGGCASKPLLVLTAVLTVAGLVTLFVLPVGAGVTFLVSATAVAATSSVRVTVGADGVRTTAAPGWPTVTIPLDRIESADTIDVRPLRWGGWGYRGSVRLFRRAAWVVRAGPGLRLQLRGGRVFVVTLDDAESAAAAVRHFVR